MAEGAESRLFPAKVSYYAFEFMNFDAWMVTFEVLLCNKFMQIKISLLKGIIFSRNLSR